ncbi:MAG: NAD(P)-dependent oxidoreductase [Pseudomonadota bacterium]
MNVGFIGVGNMGGPLASRLVKHCQLHICDPLDDNTAPLVAAGATRATNPSELGKACQTVLLCLPTSAIVEQALFGQDGLAQSLREGSLVVDMTTGDPNVTRQLAARLSQHGSDLIDAPVSGGPRGAREGTIAIMAGGSEAQFRRVKPTLDLISVNVMHAGAVGAGHAIKAGNNLLNLICRLASFEVVSMLVKDGVNPDKAVEIIQKSSGRNYATEITLPDNILSGKMFQGFTTALMHKDSGVALDIATANDVDMPFGLLARNLLEAIIEEHGAQADMSAAALTFERLSGARIRPPESDPAG